MNAQYLYYTVGGWFASGKPIEGGEHGTLSDAQETCDYFAAGVFRSKAHPVIYGWVDDNACNAVELS